MQLDAWSMGLRSVYGPAGPVSLGSGVQGRERTVLNLSTFNQSDKIYLILSSANLPLHAPLPNLAKRGRVQWS